MTNNYIATKTPASIKPEYNTLSLICQHQEPSQAGTAVSKSAIILAPLGISHPDRCLIKYILMAKIIFNFVSYMTGKTRILKRTRGPT